MAPGITGASRGDYADEIVIIEDRPSDPGLFAGER
jgi:hypothetical protein